MTIFQYIVIKAPVGYGDVDDVKDAEALNEWLNNWGNAGYELMGWHEMPGQLGLAKYYVFKKRVEV